MCHITMLFLVRRKSCGYFFAYWRESLNFLFQSANKAVASWCQEQGFVPAIVLVLHTFGSTLNFHPHIHMLLTEGGLGDDCQFDFGIWKENSFFPERVLKERFKYYLIRLLRHFAEQKVRDGLFSVPETLKRLWQRKLKCRDFYTATVRLYRLIWYVHIGERLDNARFTTRYIGRYAKRPCISETKILYYSLKEQVIVFSYRDKMAKVEKQERLSVEEFIKRLIRHIPEKNFRMIRYYGLYANRIRTETVKFLMPQIIALFSIARLTFASKTQPRNWRERILALTGKDPLLCPNCKLEMNLIAITYKSRDGPLKTKIVD